MPNAPITVDLETVTAILEEHGSIACSCREIVAQWDGPLADVEVNVGEVVTAEFEVVYEDGGERAPYVFTTPAAAADALVRVLPGIEHQDDCDGNLTRNR